MNIRLCLTTVWLGLLVPAHAQAPVDKLPQLAPGQSLGVALGLPTVPNLRNVGGYATRDGKTVARGIADRSDSFNPMSAEDLPWHLDEVFCTVNGELVYLWQAVDQDGDTWTSWSKSDATPGQPSASSASCSKGCARCPERW